MSLEPSHSYPANPNAEDLIVGLRQLPPTARVLARLQHLLADPNSGLDDIAALLRLDAPLVTRIIQISNSVLLRRGEPCRTIEESVNRVGFREIYRLVAMVASKAMVSGPLSSYGMTGDVSWRLSVGCALGAEKIAERLNEDNAVAYTVGLLHAIGRMPINQFLLNTDGKRVLTNEGFPYEHSAAELALLGYTQAEVGAQMLKKWGFASTVVEAVRSQYEPLLASEPHDRMASILHLARLLFAMAFGAGEAPKMPGEDEIFAELRMDRDMLGALVPDLRAGMDRANKITQSYH